jgi:hypothetical protein
MSVNDCLVQTPSLRSRQYLGGPVVFWLTIDLIGVLGGNFWDIQENLPFPCNCFFVGSVHSGDEANSLYFSFIPTNKPRGFSFGAFNGNEQIFQLVGSQVMGGPHYYGVFRFKDPVQLLYFHMGRENGTFSRYSVGCFAGGSDAVDIRGGLYF